MKANLEEFNILNIMDAHISGSGKCIIVILSCIGILYLLGLVASIAAREIVPIVVSIIIVVGCIAGISTLVFIPGVPLRYEVTLKQDAVIDATKWEIISQRGEIYVIEAKETDND